MNRQLRDETFFELPFSGWQVDETFYSLGARMHRMLGYADPNTTTRALFGCSIGGSQPSFPTKLDAFITRSRGAFGVKVEQILRDHTPAAFYFPWLSDQARRRAVAAGGSGNAREIRAALGVPQSKSVFPLRFCPMCVANEHANIGVAYWHLSHQFPCVWVCLDHGQMLRVVGVSGQAFSTYRLWRLPRDIPESDLERSTQNGGMNLGQLWARAEISSQIARLPPNFCFDFSLLRQMFRDAIAARGWDIADGVCSVRQFRQHWLTAHCNEQIVDPDLGLASHPRIGQQMFDALLEPGPGTNPQYLVVLIEWLFGSWTAFIKFYGSATSVNATKRSTNSMENADLADDLVRTRRDRLSAAIQKLSTDSASSINTIVTTHCAPQPKSTIASRHSSVDTSHRTSEVRGDCRTVQISLRSGSPSESVLPTGPRSDDFTEQKDQQI